MCEREGCFARNINLSFTISGRKNTVIGIEDQMAILDPDREDNFKNRDQNKIDQIANLAIQQSNLPNPTDEQTNTL